MPDPYPSGLGSSSPAEHTEQEKEASWIAREAANLMPGRVIRASYESLRGLGTIVVCLSPWGDSDPFILPCVRFRDLAVHTIVAATGGVAIVAGDFVSPAIETMIDTFATSNILVEVVVDTGFEVATTAANELVFGKPLDKVLPVHSRQLSTTAVKTLAITLRYKHTHTDAELGFYRASIHKDDSLFSNVKDYFSIEKGWFSPYLNASSRRPAIPRNAKPDVIFCQGPFVSDDYAVGERLLKESTLVIKLCNEPQAEPMPNEDKEEGRKGGDATHPTPPSRSLLSLSRRLVHKHERRGEPQTAPMRLPFQPRRLVLMLVGLKPHRGIWSTSARPSESLIKYTLLNGAPPIVLPAKLNAPIVAWDTLTLKQLWKVELPHEDGRPSTSGKFEGIVNVLFEYLDNFGVDWERVVIPQRDGNGSADGKPQDALKRAIALLLAASIRSGESKNVRKGVDPDRSGLVIWKIR